jgi:hypothetical protein
VVAYLAYLRAPLDPSDARYLGFLAGTTLADSPRFGEGLEWQWRTLDECAEEKVDRVNPTFSKYMSKETKEGPKRACWNSWIAPHNFEGFFLNFEGFFLNMGDMLVKAGDWQTARKIYANAKLSHDYPAWKFSSILDDRIEHAQENTALLQCDKCNANRDDDDQLQVFMHGCHQQ